MKKSGWTWRGLSLAGLLGLAACGGGGGGYSNAPSNGNVGGVEPQAAIGVKIGKPYAIGDQMFTPRYDRYYDQVGVASWYGPGFHGKRTANGEVYDSNDMTCAHTTLPMPSLVKITNLDTNQTALVRVNDRGPFHGGRIVDLSRAAAEKLGVVAAGTARVRVQYLPEETEQYLASKGLNMPGAEVLNARNGLSIRPVESFTTQPREVAEATLPPPAAIGVKESYLRPPSPTPVQSEENQAQTVAMLQSPPPEPASEVVQLVQSPAPADAASPPSPPPPCGTRHAGHHYPGLQTSQIHSAERRIDLCFQCQLGCAGRLFFRQEQCPAHHAEAIQRRPAEHA